MFCQYCEELVTAAELPHLKKRPHRDRPALHEIDKLAELLRPNDGHHADVTTDQTFKPERERSAVG